jgi:hypothetical protein
MDDVPAALLKGRKGRKVRITTVDKEHLEGELQDVGQAFFVLFHHNEPVPVSLSVVVTMRRTEPTTQYNARTGKTTQL